MASPIADLSYRHYDGPLESPRFRWWAIARMMIRLGFSKKSTWVFSALSAWYYLAMIFVIFVMDAISAQRPPGAPNPMDQFFGRIIWKDQFLHGFSFGQVLFLAVALILGAGSIANDNRANALLVYLSKPISKFDYLLGKWVGVFLPLLVIMVVPSAVFFIYGLLSFQDKGFISQDPWLWLKLLAIFPLGAAFHASLVVGVSSMFNQGRIAGATYAGVYFMSNFFTVVMSILFQVSSRGEGPPGNAKPIIEKMFYASVDGLNIGMCKAILGTNGTPWMNLPSQAAMVPAPPVFATVGLLVSLCLLFLGIAWTRIRAVEVVG